MLFLLCILSHYHHVVNRELLYYFSCYSGLTRYGQFTILRHTFETYYISVCNHLIF
jgi:hypothetical protein